MDEGLWEDEIIAVTHAVRPWSQLLVDVFRNDVHPPLYFVQLHVWSLASESDGWFMANSVFWGLVAIASAFLVARTLETLASAWLNAAFLAVLPAALWMSQEVRPYAWLSVGIIWTRYFATRCFLSRDPAALSLLSLFILGLAIIYSHAIGFIAVLSSSVYCFGLLAGQGLPWRDFRVCVGLHAALGLCALPIVATGLLHDANLGIAAANGDLLAMSSATVNATFSANWTKWGGAAVFCGAVVCGLWRDRTRALTLGFLITPLLIAFATAFTAHPVFKPNFFATLVTPTLAVVLADTVLRARIQIRPATATLSICLALAMTFDDWRHKQRSTDFFPASRDLLDEVREGDVVYVPQASMFWGMAWYMVGPNWGSPLDVADWPSAQWQKVYTLLGRPIVDALHLLPQKQDLAVAGASWSMSTGRKPPSDSAKRIWLVTYERVDLPAGYPPPSFGHLSRRNAHRYKTLVVTLYS